MPEPWFRFYPTDWRADPRLRMCSIAARGLWIEMLSIMHEAEPRGHLLVHGRPPTDTQLAVLAGIPPDQLPDLLGELEAAGVFSRTSKGVIYSRRMTRDTKRALAARKNGRKGGNPAICGVPATPSKETGISPSVNPPDKPPDKGRDKLLYPEARYQNKDDTASASPQQHHPPGACAPDAADAGGRRASDPPPDPGPTGEDRGAGPSSAHLGGDEAAKLRDEVLRIVGVDLDRERNPTRWIGSEPTHIVTQWLRLGLDPEEILSVVDEVMVRRGNRRPGSLAYFTEAMREAVGRKAAPPLTPVAGGRNGPAGEATRSEDRARQELIADLAFARRVGRS